MVDWQIVSAVGSIMCAVGSSAAAVVALFLGLRDNRSTVHIRGYFKDVDGYEPVENHPSCFVFECVNTGNQPVFITHVLERPRYKRNLRGVLSWIKSHKVHIVSMLGYSATDIAVRRYWGCFPMGDNVRLTPGDLCSFSVPIAVIKHDQAERHALGFVDPRKSLAFYAVDIRGKKYRVKSGATPRSFLEEATCRMTRVSRITGEVVTDGN